MMTTLLLAGTLTLQAPTTTVSRVKTFDSIKTIAVAAAPTGARFAASDYSSVVRIMDAAAGKTVLTLTGHPQPVFGLAFNPAGTELVTGDESARIYVWNAKTGKKVREFQRTAQTHARGIQSIVFSADGKSLITTGKDDTVIVWDYATAKPKTKIAGNGVVFSSARPVGKSSTMIVGTLTEGLHVRKGATFALSTRLNGHGGQGISGVAVNSLGTRAVTAGRDMNVAVWDLVGMKRIGTLKGQQDSVQHVAIAPNSKLAASSANDRNVIVWDLVSFKPVARLEQQCAVGSPLAFTADGKYLISVNVADALQINLVAPPAKPSIVVPARRRR